MLTWILVSVLIVSAMAFVGILFFVLKEKVLYRILLLLVALASGALLGGAFLHLLPESAEIGFDKVSVLLLGGILAFFILEKFLHWRHCHLKECRVHPFAYLNLVGDGIHNFVDGAIIAAAYLTSLELGIATTVAVIVHEIPQEIGDFGVLVYAGIKKKKALFYNFFSALVAVAGALITYLAHAAIDTSFLLPIAAGGFIYIALTDLIPELHKKPKLKESATQLAFIVLGMLLMLFFKVIFH